jgi:tRNA dimethylallyltransferase
MSTYSSPDKTASLPPLALIAGPTASGKSDLALQLAQTLRECGRTAVIINADSAQVYSDLAVLSARSSRGEMAGIEHRLFGTWDGSSACSAADWAAAARDAIGQAHHGQAVPILVGGTGLYLRTLLDGIAPVPPIDPAIRNSVRALPLAEMFAALGREDPARAATLAPADAARIARALEVVRSTGRPLADWQQARSGGIRDQIALHAAVLLPERTWLYQRCDQRFAWMLEHGAIAEVETLLSRSLDPALPVMRAIGVGEVASYLQGTCTLEEARTRGAQATRNYAKRQYTWFRRQPPPDWHQIKELNVDLKPYFEILLQQ